MGTVEKLLEVGAKVHAIDGTVNGKLTIGKGEVCAAVEQLFRLVGTKLLLVTVARGTASGSKEVFTAGAGSTVLGVMAMNNNESMGVTVVT